ncbi:Alginate export [Tistlia consotensis]|uniref:Alginate export n=1 Tax=Tistlia consotensis USBA 355 TaxID=560819 RepID=A0A1Y6BCF0_9PROT|nr:alginate export family protein [Tistlia consotensis]SMF03713.1 Alginate export [Tistlia consotensis USBA 355]SNR53954.1 Alginate export [Tistlia consotensis]
MRRTLVLLAAGALLAAASPALAGGRPGFAKVRFDEDWSGFDAAAGAARPLDALKRMALGPDASAWLGLGGELRERYEFTGNPTFGEDPQDPHGVWLQRAVLQGDLHLGPQVRVFGQLSSALEAGRAGGAAPPDEDRLQLQNAFLELGQPLGQGGRIGLRAGRQELELGSGRLVDVREGTGVRRSFDAGRLIFATPDWRVDGLFGRPRRNEVGVFDDQADDDKALWGLYGVGRPGFLPFGKLDLYYLGFHDAAGRYQQGTADELRHSLGLRWSGRAGPWDVNWEGLYQFGRFGGDSIRAWTLASETGYRWPEAPLAPRAFLSANVASGDEDPNDGTLGTFNPLFPRGNYFSEAAVLGPRNFFNLHPGVELSPSDDWTVTADVNFFFRYSTADGVYAPSGRLLRASNGSGERFVASAVSLNSEYALTPNLAFTAIYTHVEPGAFLRDTGEHEPVDYLELTLTAKF